MKRTRKLFAMIVIIALAVTLAPLSAFAEELPIMEELIPSDAPAAEGVQDALTQSIGAPQTPAPADPQQDTGFAPQALGDYHPDDVAAINDLILYLDFEKRFFIGFSEDDPDGWTFATWDENSSPKRLTKLDFSGWGRKYCTFMFELTGCSELREVNLSNAIYPQPSNYLSVTITGSPKLEKLDISNVEPLYEVHCKDASLTTLNLSGSGQRSDLQTISGFAKAINVSGNKLTSLDLSDMVGLQSLDCSGNELASLTLPADITKLDELLCQNNKLTALDLSNATALEMIKCSDNLIGGQLDLSATRAEDISCRNNKLESLLLPASADTVDCSNNSISQITGGANLKELYCTKNKLESLQPGGNLKILHCEENALSTLNVAASPGLQSLNCADNNLSSLDLSSNTGLLSLDCQNNSLTVLNVSANTSLISLYCQDNNLTALTIPQGTGLKTLYCQNNSLPVLDVSAHAGLEILHCGENELSRLVVSSNTNLEVLECYGNAITALNLSGLNTLARVSCALNPIESFKDPVGNALTIPPAKRGRTVFGRVESGNPTDAGNYGYDVSTGEVVLTTTPNDSRTTFARWDTNPQISFTGGTNAQSNVISFMLDQNITATPMYTYSYEVTQPLEPYVGDGLPRTLTVDGDIADYLKTAVDGQDVPASTRAGSTVVTLPASYLKTLQNGTYNVRTLFTDGYASTTLTVAYHTIAATAGLNGSISPPGSTPVATGADQTFTFTPDSGYIVDTVTVDGNDVVFSGNSHTIQNVQKDMSIHVTFKAVPDHSPQNPPAKGIPVDSSQDLTIVFNGDWANARDIRLNGVSLMRTETGADSANLSGYPDYTGILGDATQPNVTITLYKAFLQWLPDGVYSLEVEFDDGGVISVGMAEFSVWKTRAAASITSPRTGDGSNAGLWIVLCIAAGAAITGVTVFRKRNARQ